MTDLDPRQHDLHESDPHQARPQQTGPQQTGIDRLLRNSIAAPVPTLPPNFDQRVLREVNRSAQPLNAYARNLVVAYAVVSVIASAVVMRGQGLAWTGVALTAFAPLALVATVAWNRKHRLTTNI